MSLNYRQESCISSCRYGKAVRHVGYVHGYSLVVERPRRRGDDIRDFRVIYFIYLPFAAISVVGGMLKAAV